MLGTSLGITGSAIGPCATRGTGMGQNSNTIVDTMPQRPGSSVNKDIKRAEAGLDLSPTNSESTSLLLLQTLLHLLQELLVLVAPIFEVLQGGYFGFDYPPERYLLQ